MGRLSRYKKSKKVFDVDNLFAGDDKHDDPVAENETRGDNSKGQKLIIKFGADGQPIDKEKYEALQKKLNYGMPTVTKHGLDFEKRRENETLAEFKLRVTKEAQISLMREKKKATKRNQKLKEVTRARKEKKMEKKRKRVEAQFSKDDDMGEKERKIYKVDQPKTLFDRVDAPPEFPSEHLMKKHTNPTDRTRFAKLSFAQNLATPTTASTLKKNQNRTDYERLQLEAMRARVMGKYDEMRKKRREGAL